MDNKKDKIPYIPADKVLPEITVTSIITGVLLAMIFGAANAYLGLRVGMTVSASIPAAVVSMGVLRVLLKRNSILESNIVQTIGSAGESLAAGAIFTIPALFLWAKEGIITKPSIIEITLIALLGGLLGVFFMVPLRNTLIVKEHNILPYPEGTACAEVLLAGEKGGSKSSVVFLGMGFSAIIKFIIDGLKIVPGEVSLKMKGYSGEIGTQIYPAVLGVGYICGPKIASYMFSGGVLSWLVIIPLIVMFGENSIFYPANETIGELFKSGGANAIWSSYIRYIGAGALACGGVISLVKSLPLILNTFRETLTGIKLKAEPEEKRTDKNISMKFVLVMLAILTLSVWLIPAIPVTITGAVIIVLFGFFFSSVSSRMVGLVGSSNNPVSGMSIATLLIATFILKLFGQEGTGAMVSAIVIGSVICIITAIASDTSQDLKTGYLLGATPLKQQIGEVIGVVFAALSIGGTLYLLDSAWGFGSKELAAPQATLMKLIVEGVMEANLPWGLVFSGVFIAAVAEILKIPVLAFAIGIYLPVHLNTCIMIGGLIRLLTDRIKENEKKRKNATSNGLLFCSGMIAGEGIAGILLAVLAILKITPLIDMSWLLEENMSFANSGSIILLSLIIFAVLKQTVWSREENEE
ncbi:MAG: oligopeptide transporter, OPT family [Clostridia bacterium]|nr:oligopeptide transporter, OPT family [Clostridia bacterium]